MQSLTETKFFDGKIKVETVLKVVRGINDFHGIKDSFEIALMSIYREIPLESSPQVTFFAFCATSTAYARRKEMSFLYPEENGNDQYDREAYFCFSEENTYEVARENFDSLLYDFGIPLSEIPSRFVTTYR